MEYSREDCLRLIGKAMRDTDGISLKEKGKGTLEYTIPYKGLEQILTLAGNGMSILIMRNGTEAAKAVFLYAEIAEAVESGTPDYRDICFSSSIGFRATVRFPLSWSCREDAFNPLELRGKDIEIYTDGGCRIDQSCAGGWGYAVIYGGNAVLMEKGHQARTTNNRMELMGAIRALEKARELVPGSVRIKTDSQYLAHGVNIWSKDWMLPDGTIDPSKKNPDLWQELLSLRDSLPFPCEFVWVKGHNGNRWNELCDRLASEGIEDAIREMHP